MGQDSLTPTSQGAWHRFVLDSLPMGVITVDQDRHVTYMNPYALKLTGWRADQARGRFCGEVMRGGQCKQSCPLAEVLNRDQDTVDTRTTLTDEAGETVPIRLRITAMFDDQGRLLGAVEAFYDISRVVALEQEREQTLSFFAHDMKSPLVGAQGFLHRLLDGKAGELNDKQRSYLNVVLTQLQHVQSLVGDYLDMVRLGSTASPLSLEAVDLGQAVRQAAEPYAQRARHKGLGWAVEVDDGLPQVRADPRRLGRVLANLMDNAVKYSQDGRVVVSCATEGSQWVRVLVCDRGPGLSEQDMTSLFTPFKRGSAAKQAEGTGLGLAAVRAIVEAHGGEVFASNREGGGACFAVLLPPAEGGQ